MNPHLEVTRPSVCLLTVFGMVVGLLILDLSYGLWLLPLISTLLICAAGNVINDYFDAEIDKVNRPKRPIPSGRLSRKAAFRMYALLNAAGLLAALLVSLPFFALAAVNSIVLYVYSARLKKTILGNLADTYLAVSVFIAPVLIKGGFLDILSSSLLILALIPFFANYGREILKDVEDAKGDKKSGARTLPIVFGKSRAMRLARAMILVAAAALFAPYFKAIFPANYLIFAALGAIGCVYIASLKNATKMQKCLKALMFYVLAVFLAFSI
ncbi:MAG: geranylgeranylglycerol-phosphate geranylgeranyltransferase [Candidatus Aenigmatarchaeota archaeon]